MDTNTAPAPRSFIDKITPKAGVRPQLYGAAMMWTVGSFILLVRGTFYLRDEHWAWWLIAIAAILGVFKSRILLDRVSRKAVLRIYERGRACFFGFFSPKTWLFVAVMMGGGMLLRRTGLDHGILSVLYLGVGAALLLSDRIFWTAALTGRVPARDAEPAVAAAK